MSISRDRSRIILDKYPKVKPWEIFPHNQGFYFSDNKGVVYGPYATFRDAANCMSFSLQNYA